MVTRLLLLSCSDVIWRKSGSTLTLHSYLNLKYGFSCQGNVLRISFLRSAAAADAEQDQGKSTVWDEFLVHCLILDFSRWTSCLMGCDGHFSEPDVQIAGYLYNSLVRGSGFVGWSCWLYCSPMLARTVVTTTVVLRPYEAFGRHAQVRLMIYLFSKRLPPASWKMKTRSPTFCVLRM